MNILVKHFIILTFLFPLSICAQYSWQWAITEGDELNEYISAMDCDINGNIYVTGGFQGTVDFFGETLISAGWVDIFVASFNPEGQLLWVKYGGGSYDDSGRDICVNDQFVYVTGGFTEQAAFGSEALTSLGARDMFLLKFDLNGNQEWAINGGSVTDDAGNSVALDENGNIYIVGDINYDATFGNHTVTSFGFTDIFLAKYDPLGECQWANSAGGSIYDYGGFLEVIDENIIISGSFNDVAQFGNSTITSVDFVDIYIAQYLTDGSFVEVTSAGGTNNEGIQGMAVDNDLNVYISGWYMLDITFGTNSFNSNGGYDIFLAKYVPGSGFDWSQSYGGNSIDEAQGMYCDLNGDMILCGTFESTISFGNIELISEGFDDGFMLKFDQSGTINWVYNTGGSGSQNVNDCNGDYEGNYYFAGDFVDEFKIDENTFMPVGGYDLFLAKLGISTSVKESKPEKQIYSFSITPNPAQSEVLISYNLKSDLEVSIDIYDYKGTLVYQLRTEFQNTGQKQILLDVGNFIQGIYYCVISTIEGTQSRKFVKL